LIQKPDDPIALSINSRLTARRISFAIRFAETSDDYQLPVLFKNNQYLCDYDEFQYINLDDLVD